MKIVRNKSTKVVQYLFNDADDVILTSSEMCGLKLAVDINSNTHELISDITAPEKFCGNTMMWDNGDWTIINIPAFNSFFTSLKESMQHSF